MPTAKLKVVKEPTLGELTDTLWQLREDKRAKEAEVKTIEKSIDEIEEQLMAKLNEQGLDAARGKLGSVSLGKPMVKFSFDLERDGFEEFTKYVKKTGYFHLFQRRLSDTACREIFEQKGAIPGLKHFTKRTLNLKTLA